MSARRRSITVHGMHDESLADLESHDEFFSSNEAEEDSESDESDDSSDDKPPAQRIYHSHGAASAASVSSDMPKLETVSDAEEEFLSESEDDDSEVRTATTTVERAEQTSALVASGSECHDEHWLWLSRHQPLCYFGQGRPQELDDIAA